MAYAGLVSLSQTINRILNPGQYSITLKEEHQIISLSKYVLLLKAFLEDFPQKGQSLEGRMRDLANEGEDILECLMLERNRWRCESSRNKHPDGKRQKKKLKRMTEKLDSVVQQVMEIKSSFRKKDVQFGESSTVNAISELASPLVGFEDDLMAIKCRLCGLDSPQLQAVPILGMGGIGKTTLARNVFDDPLITERFHIRAWVAVSQDYCEEDILSALLDCLKDLDAETMDLGCNEERKVRDDVKVYRSLKHRRFLIVMDDVWSTEAWDFARRLFPDDNNGSRIILTTRLSDVAAYPDPCSPYHELSFMDAQRSWDLLKQKLFKDEDCPPELEDVGRMIAGSCRGLPLAIVVIAGLLSTVTKTRASWAEIAENVNSIVSANGQFEEILSLSFVHLPHHLRPCFLYMGLFPRDQVVRVSKLVRLWVAEGFLECCDESKSLEETAEDCLEDLITRSLVLVTERKPNGRIKSCSVHDLMRGLCLRKALEQQFLVNLKDSAVEKRRGRWEKILQKQRRLSTCSAGLASFSAIHRPSTIHTIMWFHHRSVLLLDSLRGFRFLRVLDNQDSYVESLPVQLFELFHLRYLGMNYLGIIPSAISKLQNLETLFVNGTDPWRPLCLPLEIWLLPRLRHVVSGRFPDPEPEGMACALEKLQTLSSQSYHICSVRILKMIPNLKKLEICFADGQEATHLQNLVCLNQLETLKLLSLPTTIEWPEASFAFPWMLKKLSLVGLPLPWGKMSVVGSLPNLEVLKLRDFVCKASNTWETNEEEFTQLRFLLIENSNLQHWMTESSHFPRLKVLVLCHCWSLTEIPEDIGEIPTLELIEVKGSKTNTLVESAKRILESQLSCGNDGLEVVCAPTPSIPPESVAVDE